MVDESGDDNVSINKWVLVLKTQLWDMWI